MIPKRPFDPLSPMAALLDRRCSLRASARREKRRRQLLFDAVLLPVLALVLACLISTHLLNLVWIRGDSMLPTLHSGERVLASPVAYWGGEPERGDIVITRYPDRDELFIKRVIALPGESVSIASGTIYINGAPLDEPWATVPPTYTLAACAVEEGHYFVLGDNRADSSDSHLASVGPLPRSMIRARVLRVVWPLSQWRDPYAEEATS